MDEWEEQFRSLPQRLQHRERLARRKTLVYALVPMLLCGALVWTSIHAIRLARRRSDAKVLQTQRQERKRAGEALADALLRERASSEKKVKSAMSYAEAEAQLAIAGVQVYAAGLEDELEEKQTLLSLAEHVVEERPLFKSENSASRVSQIGWGDSFVLRLGHPKQFRLLSRIRRMRADRVGWKPDGRSPKEGFNSSSFAAYVLAEERIPGVGSSDGERLREVLPKTETPEVGDVVFYDKGYTMFYFRDLDGRPFCVGMTPLGIVALELEFGPRLLGYGTVAYEEGP